MKKLRVKLQFVLDNVGYPGIDSWVQSWVSWVEPGLPRKPIFKTQKTQLAGFINIFLCGFELD